MAIEYSDWLNTFHWISMMVILPYFVMRVMSYLAYSVWFLYNYIGNSNDSSYNYNDYDFNKLPLVTIQIPVRNEPLEILKQNVDRLKRLPVFSATVTSNRMVN